MVAAVGNSIFQEHLTERILGRLCEAARLVTADLTANRNRLRELLDDLAYELDAGDVAMSTLQHEESCKKPQSKRILFPISTG